MKHDDLPRFSVKIIPVATSVFSVPKLDLKRNNVRALSEGIVPSLN